MAAERLTPREVEILTLIAGGNTSKQIARLLGVSFKTVVTHRTHIMGKLDAHRVADLVRHAVRLGLVLP